MDVTTTRARLVGLRAERMRALELGIENPSEYMTRLEAAIGDARHDYVTAVVIEIAVLRESIAGPTNG